MKGYVCSEYDPDVQPGSFIQDGVRCEDLQSMTFNDETFDLVITQTVFEHILEPDLAWKEIARVLKPSGYHIFSIRFQKSPITERRVKIDDGEEIFIMPKVYHNDGVRNSLVYTDYGLDLLDHLKEFGFSTELHSLGDMDSNTYRIDGGYIFISRQDRH
ncbi:MAG: class I SAM-dependent methyltransferase [Candidatus Marinimicrobia bacterium]|nr:class I SAM-dependent methyltransferase [Candidatus Neomarinimicrobiota bacterium]